MIIKNKLLLKANSPSSRTGRIYTQNCLEEVYKQLCETPYNFIYLNSAKSLNNSPENDLVDIAGIYQNVVFTGIEIFLDIHTTNTPKGKILKNLFNDNVEFSIRPRLSIDETTPSIDTAKLTGIYIVNEEDKW